MIHVIDTQFGHKMADPNSKARCVQGWREGVTWLSQIDGLKIMSGQRIMVMGFIRETEYRCLNLQHFAKKHCGKVLTFYAMVFQLLTISSRPIFIKLVILEFLDRGFHVFHNYFHSHFDIFCFKIYNKYYQGHTI